MISLKGSKVLVIQPPSLEEQVRFDNLVETLKENDAFVLIKHEEHANTNYFESEEEAKITHIITSNTDFKEYPLARKYMIPVTTPEWVWESVKMKRMLNPKMFNPDPRYIMRDVFLCIGDDVRDSDKEVIYEAVKCLGGQCLDDLTKYTTHLISNDLSNEKSLIALSASGGSSQQDKIDIKIVSPQWILESLGKGEKLDSQPYLLTGSSLAKEATAKKTSKESEVQNSASGEHHTLSHLFRGKIFYIAEDYNLSDDLFNSLRSLIGKNGGSVTQIFDMTSVNVYLGKYRHGSAYKEASSSNAVVGNLPWLYSMIVSNEWISPLESNILHYPIPAENLNEFKHIKVSVTNYSGDARGYLADLIEILGGTFTKTLTKENDFLIASRPEGKKYEAAATKWSHDTGNGNVRILNHTWLEECYKLWKLLDPSQRRFVVSEIGPANLGSTVLNKTLLKRWYIPESDAEIGDSEDSERSDNQFLQASNENNGVEVSVADEGINALTDDQDTGPKQNTAENDNSVDVTSSTTIQRSGRSAAKMAAKKLHNSISDLNNYKDIMKSSRRMKSYMEELESSVTNNRRDSENEQSTNDDTLPPAKRAKSETPEMRFHVVAVMTGCEHEVKLNRSDLGKLAGVGIKILSDSSKTTDANTLIAPKILRTEKFLKSLAFVDQIVHPNYLIDILKKANLNNSSWIQISKEFKVSDYSLEKVFSQKEVNAELGVKSNKVNGLSLLLSSDKKGSVFEGLKFNLSANLNGGVEVVSGILSGHGAEETKSIKSITSQSSVKNLLKSGNEEMILVAHKTKDAKMIQNFKKYMPQGNVVQWDWCVKSIFKMQLEKFEDYKL